MSGRLSPLTRARALETWDRVRLDSLGLAASVARHTLPPTWADRADHMLAARRPGPRHRLMPLLEAFAELRPEAFFVQVGANDGDQQDHLRQLILHSRWKGIMVEPVPAIFERLRRNYAGVDRIVFENAAVGAEDGEANFFHVPEPTGEDANALPPWFDGLGSLRRDVLTAHRRYIPDIEERLVEIRVPSLTFASLLARHGVEDVDLLLTDTEGYDYEILRRVDFAVTRPALIIYESWHLGDVDKPACAELLQGYGYVTYEYGLDTWCLMPDELRADERAVLDPIWTWVVSAEDRRQPLPPTRLLRRAGRRVVKGAPRRSRGDGGAAQS